MFCATHWVAHNHNWNSFLVFHEHLVDSVNTRQHTVLVGADPSKICRLNSPKRIKVRICHCLYNELLIFTKKEKRSWFALWLSGFKDHLFIFFRVQWLFKNIVRISIPFAQVCKNIRRPFNNRNILIDHESGLLDSSIIIKSGSPSVYPSKSSCNSFASIWIHGDGFDVPVLFIFNLNGVQKDNILALVIVILVDLEVVSILRRATRHLADHSQNDVD